MFGRPSGVITRLNRFLRRGRCGPVVVAAVDDLLLSGPNGRLKDLPNYLRDVGASGVDGVLCHPRTSEVLAGIETCDTVTRIVSVSASTPGDGLLRKTQLFSVDHALRVGADAISFQINCGASSELDSLRDCARVSELCHSLGVPIVIVSYPRSDRNGDDVNFHSS